jgi:hypothetical protein
MEAPVEGLWFASNCSVARSFLRKHTCLGLAVLFLDWRCAARLFLYLIVKFFALCYFTRIIPLFALCPVFCWMLVYFTWQLVSYDCYFEIKEGVIELGKIKVKKTGRRKLPRKTLRISECELGGIFSESSVAIPKEATVYDFSESKKSLHRIFLLYRGQGKTEVVIFEGTAKSARIISSLCKGAASLKGQTLHG